MSTPSRTSHSLLLALSLAALAAIQPAAAEDSDYERCRALESDTERLACYDAMGNAEAPGTDAATAPSAEPGVAATASAAAAAPEKPAKKEKKEKKATTYTAVVTAMSKRPYGQAVVELDNGEVWSEQQASHAFLVNVGDTVTLKKSMFSSSYQLVAPGGRAYRMTRLE